MQKLASCNTIQPWIIDETFRAALKPEALAMLQWNNSDWALPIALDANVIYYNRLLVPNGVPESLLDFVASASDCARRMVFRNELNMLSGFFVGTTLFPEPQRCQDSAGENYGQTT